MKNENESENKNESSFVHKNGITYFTKRVEQRVLFAMTMAMLIWGVVEYTKDLF